MKTFEVYRIEPAGNEFVASTQADYFQTRGDWIQFYQRGFFSNKLIGEIYLRAQIIILDTEFAIAPRPEPKAFSDALPVVSDDITMDEVLASAPTPRRRKSKGSTLGLD